VCISSNSLHSTIFSSRTILYRMYPSYNPKGMQHHSNITPHLITQIWHQNGKCPEHTIPIRRTKEEHVLRASSVRRFGTKMPRSIPLVNPINDTNTPNILRGHQYATASARYDKCHGSKGTFNMWKPAIARANDFSLTQLWITAGSYNGNNLNTIEVGWQVFPNLYGDSNTRLFIYWTRDAYQTTGCYNLLCSGFIQTSNQITIGGSISPTSTYGGTQYDIDILVWKGVIGGYKLVATMLGIGHHTSSLTWHIVPPLLCGAARYFHLMPAKHPHIWVVDTFQMKGSVRRVTSRTSKW
uniref:Neprosin PEP catalytic domain-containing protein n=1 Tax=Aegilops tauschii subsp. strangulata TaxID=200361 RepID=A0A453MJI1_AEGTS